MQSKNIYHMTIDQVEIFVLKSFKDSHVLKLFSNLFHTLPALYAHDLRPNSVVWHIGRRIVLSELELKMVVVLFSVNIHCLYVEDKPFMAWYTSMTALRNW